MRTYIRIYRYRDRLCVWRCVRGNACTFRTCLPCIVPLGKLLSAASEFFARRSAGLRAYSRPPTHVFTFLYYGNTTEINNCYRWFNISWRRPCCVRSFLARETRRGNPFSSIAMIFRKVNSSVASFRLENNRAFFLCGKVRNRSWIDGQIIRCYFFEGNRGVSLKKLHPRYRGKK